MQYRSDRLAHELKNEVSNLIARELRDPRVGFATVTEAKVSPDLSHARIYVSVLGSTEEQRTTRGSQSCLVSSDVLWHAPEAPQESPTYLYTGSDN
jgi:ribosome-binding factor A